MQKRVNTCLAVIGGDDREIVLIRELSSKGYKIKVFGFPQKMLPDKVVICQSISEAIKEVNFIILPMPGIKNNGTLYAKYAPGEIYITTNDFASISKETPIFVGVASNYFKKLASTLKLKMIEVADLDEIAIPNSIPSAEGAIQIAMEQLPITIHNSQTFVVGFGRVAETLSAMLKGLGAFVTVIARNPSQLAKCKVLGYCAVELSQFSKKVNEADVIFNTVPAIVIGEKILSKMKKETLIIDLASTPGGTDFVLAEKFGINAMLVPGLPGKVAPLTAGEILAEAYAYLIESYF